MSQQGYASHRKWVPLYHFFLALLVLAILIGSVVNVVKSSGTASFYSATLLLAVAAALVLVFFYVRAFPLKAQDRAIKAEENLRCYVRTGKLLDPRLTVRQIIGLRFASDDEYDALAEKAVQEQLGEGDIKKLIANWRSDDYRV
ncbi:MAG: hypothetical protein HKN37_17865 [Rhodothermales bacterium]|nr:hypothetical protein [Rhodothermales bacterium]